MSDLPYELRIQLFARKRRSLDHIEQGRNLSPDVAHRLAGITHTWRDIRPGVAVALAQAGFDASTPQVRTVAQLATQQAATYREWKQQLSKVSTLKQLEIPDEQFKALPKALQHAYVHRARQAATEQIENQPGSPLDYLPVVGAVKGINEGASPTEIITRIVPGMKMTTALEGKALGVAGKAPVVGEPLKTGVRHAAVTAQLPLDTLNASIREAVANAKAGKFVAPQMTFGELEESGEQVAQQTLAYQNFVKRLSVGSGFLPDPASPGAQAAAQAARDYSPFLVGGHAFTPGRWFADQFFEPNTEPFNIFSGIVDAAVAIRFDPTAEALKAVGTVRKAETAGVHLLPETRVLDVADWQNLSGPAKEALLVEQGAGLYRTTGPIAINRLQKDDWLASKTFMDGKGQQLADLTTPSEIKRRFPEIPVTDIHGRPILDDLAKAKSVGEVRDLMARTTEIAGPGDLPGVSYKVRRVFNNRLFAKMEYGVIVDPTDKNTNWSVLDNIMRGANVSEQTRNRVLDGYVRNDNVLATVDDASEAMAQALMAHGTPEADARKWVSFFREDNHRATSYDVNQATGVERLRPGIGVDGRGHILPAPSLSTEQFSGPLMMPDARQLRRASSEFSFITGTKPWAISQTALALPANTWKAFQLLTARMAVRDFGETQLLLATRGFTNAFTDPKRYIALQMGDHPNSLVTRMLDKLPGLDPEFLYGPDGLRAAEHADELLMHSALAIHGPEVIATKGFLNVPVTHPDAPAGFAEMLGRAAGDPIVRGVAKADTPLAAKEWFWSGDGAKYRISRAKITDVQDNWMRSKLAQKEITGYTPLGDLVNDRAAADRYIDDVIMPRIRDLSGGNGDIEIMEALRTGQLGGQRIYGNLKRGWDTANINPVAIERAEAILTERRGPQNWVIIRDQVQTGGRGPNIGQKFIDAVFHGLVDVPDRYLNRAPAWKQLHWEETIRNLPYVDAKGYRTILNRAEKANLPKDLMDRIRNTVLDGSTEERLTAKQLTTLAKANAADRMKTIVHDLTTRSQFFDMTRFLFPFGDAFRLVAKRWLQAAWDEPQMLERMRQGIWAARQEGSSTISTVVGDPVPSGEGFFHKDEFGQDVFTLPASTWMNTKLLGVPIPLNSHVSGLSMIGNGYPGFGGPALTLPAKWFLPNTPTGNKVRDIIFPFGGSESFGVGADVGQAFMPSWLRKVADGPVNARARANSINAMLQTLASTGEYDLEGPNAIEEQQRLVEDAEKKSRLLYIIQGAAQFVVPGAPTPEAMVKDKSGKLVVAQVLTNKYQEHLKRDGPQPAMKWFLDTFGTNNIFATQKASTAIGYAAPVTREAQDWVNSNPEVRDKYPLTYGLFAPSGGSFDVSTYGEQFKTGERRPLTAKEQVAQAENRLGFYIYNQAQEALYSHNNGKPLNAKQQLLLTEFRKSLKAEYPGFDSFAAQPYDTTKRREAAIEEITRAVEDPVIAKTSAGKAVAMYLKLREAAIAKSQTMDLRSPFQAQKALPLRALLRAGADRLMASTPEFRSVWDNIFSRELAQDPGT